MLSGLAQLNLELSSACDKTHLCTFCGHQKPEVNPIRYGHMPLILLDRIREQLEPGIVVSFHRDGEPTAHPQLGAALSLYRDVTTSLVTHGLNLAKRAGEIIDLCTTLTVSAFRGDPDGKAQFKALTQFMVAKGARLPHVQVKIVGDMDQDDVAAYEELGCRVIRRLIHVPTGNHKYAHRSPTVPEVGICLDALHRPSVDWEGRVYLCNRLDGNRETYIGDANEELLDAIWNGQRRASMVLAHKYGRRDQANATCSSCTYFGVPSAYEPSRELPMVHA